jgi:16S rRNA (guanine527-N7)-methyltransferase
VADPVNLRARLQSGLAALGLPLADEHSARLIAYLELLERWNATYNLTAVRDTEAMVARHLLDSLAILPYVHAAALVDLGSGAGLPGVPLAIARPELAVTLVEANGKKARFLREVVRSLALAHVVVLEQRAERVPAAGPFPIAVARALAALPALVRLAAPWLARDGELLAMKGPGHDGELRALPPGWVIAARHRLAVPGLDAERWLVVVKQSAGAAA